jgi:hypothetical protein
MLATGRVLVTGGAEYYPAWAGNRPPIYALLSSAEVYTPAGPAQPYTGAPVSLPGVIEAENFDDGGQAIAYRDLTVGNSGGGYRATDVDLQGTSDVGGGYNVGWVDAGEWLTYTVNVATTGVYAIQVRVAAPSAGGMFHVVMNSVDVTGPIAVPATGGWQAWVTVERRGIHLAAGVQVLRLVMDAVGGTGAVGNFNWIRVTADSGAGSPYGGTPVPLPGLIEAENFDNGGEGVAYHDTSPGNSGGAYRGTDVDLQATSDVGGGYNVGWVDAGEGLTYTVNVATTGVYSIQVRVAAPSGGGVFHVEMNGVDVTGPIAVPPTGGWQSWVTVARNGISLAAGTQVLRLAMDTVGGSGAVGNFNYLQVVSGSVTSSSRPYGGIAASLPGLIQAENFDDGGQNAAYDDMTAGNYGGQYRSTDVDIESTTDSGGGYNVGWIAAGEWLQYTVNLTAGTYTLDVRVACNGPGGTFHVMVDGVAVTGALTIPNTGGWQQWTDVTTVVTLPGGMHLLRVDFDTIGSSGTVGNLNYIDFRSDSGGGAWDY